MMLSIMRAIHWLLVCIPCASYGLKMQLSITHSDGRHPSEKIELKQRRSNGLFRIPDPSKMLTAILLTFNPATGRQIPMHGFNHETKSKNDSGKRIGFLGTSMTLRPKLTEFRTGPNYEPPERLDSMTPPGPRDVVLKLYDISTPELCKAASAIAFKQILWFPKLCVSVGQRTWTWAFDGGPKETYGGIIENVAGGPPLRTWNLGATRMSDSEIDVMIAEMGSIDYTSDEYDLFLRNCNHFGLDLAERLAPENGGLSAADTSFIDGRVLHESEAILNNQLSFQQSATQSVFRLVQNIITKSWHEAMKRSLREYEEEHNIPVGQRIQVSK